MNLAGKFNSIAEWKMSDKIWFFENLWKKYRAELEYCQMGRAERKMWGNHYEGILTALKKEKYDK